MITGSHTRSHQVLSKLTVEEAYEEIVSSIELVDTLVPSQLFRSFCYPYGGYLSFTAEIEQILTDLDVAFSFNVESRDIKSEDYYQRPHALPRFDCNEFPFGNVDSI